MSGISGISGQDVLTPGALTLSRAAIVGPYADATLQTKEPPFDKPGNLALWADGPRITACFTELVQGLLFDTDASRKQATLAYANLSGARAHSKRLVTLRAPRKAQFKKQAELVAAYADLRPDRAAEIVAQVGFPVPFWASVIGLHEHRHKKTLQLLDLASSLAVHVQMRFKQIFATPRPEVFSPQIQPMIPSLGHGSWPNGHATEAFLAATLIEALIDGGLALANNAFLDAQGASRIQHFWRQDNGCGGPRPGQGQHRDGHVPLDPARAGRTPGDLGYGHELNCAAIAQAMHRFTPAGGTLDENALYRHLQLWDLTNPVNHGTHVMGLASGHGSLLRPHNDTASHCDLVAVQLDWPNILDTSGGAMNVSILDGLIYILTRCHEAAPVVVNISWGTLAGPHDGSSVLEAAMDQIIDLMGGRLQITVPAGNAHQSRTHANATLAPGAEETLHWRIQPDDHTQSFLEIWLPEGADGMQIAVTPPGQRHPLPAMRPGQSGLWTGEDASCAKAKPLCALIYPESTALGTRGTCALLALTPTASWHADTATAPCGVWQVRLTNTGTQAMTFDAYIERDDVALGQHTGARQSYFEDPRYDTSSNLGSFVDDPANPTPIRRSGTFNSLSTGQRTLSVGGTRRVFDPALGSLSHFARYSPQRPDPDAARAQRPGVKKLPDTLQSSDDNAALWGVLGIGTLSGSVARLAGTSSAAPQEARNRINAV